MYQTYLLIAFSEHFLKMHVSTIIYIYTLFFKYFYKRFDFYNIFLVFFPLRIKLNVTTHFLWETLNFIIEIFSNILNNLNNF